MFARNDSTVNLQPATKKKAPALNSVGGLQVLRSSVHVALEEFDHYRLEAADDDEAEAAEPSLCLSLKEFRNFLWFGESMNMPMQLRFSDSSKWAFNSKIVALFSYRLCFSFSVLTYLSIEYRLIVTTHIIIIIVDR